MKKNITKIFTVGLASIFMLSLVACSSDQEQPVTPTPAPTPVVEETVETETETDTETDTATEGEADLNIKEMLTNPTNILTPGEFVSASTSLNFSYPTDWSVVADTMIISVIANPDKTATVTVAASELPADVTYDDYISELDATIQADAQAAPIEHTKQTISGTEVDAYTVVEDIEGTVIVQTTYFWADDQNNLVVFAVTYPEGNDAEINTIIDSIVIG